jgi:hypothetical protein
MTKMVRLSAIALLLAGTAASAADYGVRAGGGDAVQITHDGARALYQPVFTIIRAEGDPGLKLSKSYSTPGKAFVDANPENYPLPNWRKAQGEGYTDNLYEAGKVTIVRATASRNLADGGVAWSFASNSDFTLVAEMHPVAGAAPRISWTFTARRAGWYTIGYTGGPASNPAHDDGFLQPLIWQEKRFPRGPLLSAESMGGLPLTLVSAGGFTGGLSVDPKESPYRLPTLANARFGVMLRNPQGQAQPTAFAPLLGQAASLYAAGQSSSFAVRPLLVKGDWYAAFTQTARDLFGFADIRENVDQPLNKTIDTMVEFAMDDAHSGWDADLKGFDYNTDVKGTVKVVSALHPLSVALIEDDPEIYRLRALPVTEFLMSRTKYLYNALPDEAGQNAARDMKGPAAETSELAGLYQMSKGESPVFDHYAKEVAGKPRALNLLMVSGGDTFWEQLAIYRLTGDKAVLAHARALADAYIKARVDTPQPDFSDVHIDKGGQFWSDFSPRWVELFELWQETGEARYLRAAQMGAREYASYAWYFPAIPAGDVTVDQHDAPVGEWQAKPEDKGIRTPPQTLPAWQVSQIGLTPEASTTYMGNPSIFMAHQAAYELRIAAATGDPFLHDVARAAIVGRYKTYPGYDINVAFSNVYARDDYPIRPFRELTYNEIYYNHVWPNIALLVDYLVSDFEMRSGGAIKFPARFAQGYAYLRSKVYGDRPGIFMGDDDVRLWMPRHLVSIDDAQANYLTGYGKDRFFLALTNEAPTARTVMVSLDKQRIPYEPGRAYKARLWQDGKPAGSVTVVDGKVSLPLSPRGLTAIAVDGLPVFTRLQESYFDGKPAPVDDHSFRTDTTPVGNATAMLLGFGNQHDFYLWTSASDSDVGEARLTVYGPGPERTLSDNRHPFEFSLPIGDAGKVDYRIQFVRKDGTIVDGGRHSVSR